MSPPTMTGSEKEGLYLKYDKRPQGCLPFETEQVNGATFHKIPVGEIFCRVSNEEGELCVNDNRYQSTNAVRLHIKLQHPGILYHPGPKGPTSQADKALARVQFVKCMDAVFAHTEKIQEVRDEEAFALTPLRGKSAATKALKANKVRKVSNLQAKLQAAAKTHGAGNRFDTPIHKNKPNQAAMRKKAGLAGGRKCARCRGIKLSKCPDLEAEDWDDVNGCSVVFLFKKPAIAEPAANAEAGVGEEDGGNDDGSAGEEGGEQ